MLLWCFFPIAKCGVLCICSFLMFFFFFCLYGSVKTSLLILCLKVCKDVIYILLDCGDESFMLESYFK